MKASKKIIYIGFTGFLTSLAMTACYWQTNKYLDSRQRWNLIAKQLSSSTPIDISSISEKQQNQLFPYKYVSVNGQLSPQSFIITRPRGLRTGYLVLRKITYSDRHSNKNRQIIALDGWCPQHCQRKMDTNLQQLFQGILRKKQSKDYLHTKLKQSDLQKYNMNTWIDLDKYLLAFNITPDPVNTLFYFQILKPIDNLSPSNHSSSQSQENQYPYRYSVDNFQLPYLTPDKHRGYATFWLCTSIVGLTAILKVFRMK